MYPKMQLICLFCSFCTTIFIHQNRKKTITLICNLISVVKCALSLSQEGTEYTIIVNNRGPRALRASPGAIFT